MCPILEQSSITSIFDLQPFFHALVQSSGAENPLSSHSDETCELGLEPNGDRSDTASLNSGTSTITPATFESSIGREDQAQYIDKIFEIDFLEPIPNTWRIRYDNKYQRLVTELLRFPTERT